MTGGRPYTELVDDVAHAASDELDDLLKYIDMIMALRVYVQTHFLVKIYV
jgi:hypothetical protein